MWIRICLLITHPGLPKSGTQTEQVYIFKFKYCRGTFSNIINSLTKLLGRANRHFPRRGRHPCLVLRETSAFSLEQM